MERLYLFMLVINLVTLSLCRVDPVVVIQVQDKVNQEFETIAFEDLVLFTNTFEGKAMALTGFFNYEFESVALYKPKKDLNRNNMSHAIWLGFHPDLKLDEEQLRSFHGKKVEVRGLFNSKWKGHLNQYIGELEMFYMKGY